jgi:hypothetical protein
LGLRVVGRALTMGGWADENQTPSRLMLQPSVGDVSASAGLGTEQHNEWLRVEKQLFDALKSISGKVLGGNRLWKYKVSLFEQEVTLGALLPEDAADHVTCVMRTISNLRVVNVNAAKFVDIIGRRGDSVTDKDLKVFYSFKLAFPLTCRNWFSSPACSKIW